MPIVTLPNVKSMNIKTENKIIERNSMMCVLQDYTDKLSTFK